MYNFRLFAEGYYFIAGCYSSEICGISRNFGGGVGGEIDDSLRPLSLLYKIRISFKWIQLFLIKQDSYCILNGKDSLQRNGGTQ
jgi:hypothetical protein